jgi:hypothetical protein
MLGLVEDTPRDGTGPMVTIRDPSDTGPWLRDRNPRAAPPSTDVKPVLLLPSMDAWSLKNVDSRRPSFANAPSAVKLLDRFPESNAKTSDALSPAETPVT